MTLLATIGARRRGQPPSDPAIPYVMPTSAPWNAPTYATTPTPDGTGSVVHPSVVDMCSPWNGYRYWMAATPYYQAVDAKENPCILGSNDGFTWHVPAGLTNPLVGAPVGGYNSDTEIVWDPDNARMVCYWRSVVGSTEAVWAATSVTGSVWTAAVQQYQTTGGTANILSPSVVRLAADRWAMFYVVGQAGFCRITAPSALGPWSSPTAVSYAPGVGWLWHLGVQNVGGVLYAILDERSEPWGYWPATSTDDGLTWAVGSQFMSNTAGWDDRYLYRAQFQPHEDGTHIRVWYSSDSTAAHSWRVGYTQVPRSLWPDPPAI